MSFVLASVGQELEPYSADLWHVWTICYRQFWDSLRLCWTFWATLATLAPDQAHVEPFWVILGSVLAFVGAMLGHLGPRCSCAAIYFGNMLWCSLAYLG